MKVLRKEGSYPFGIIESEWYVTVINIQTRVEFVRDDRFVLIDSQPLPQTLIFVATT